MLVLPEEVDRTVGEIRSTTSRLDPCPAQLIIKEARGSLCQWLSPIIKASLREGVLPTILKEAVIRPLFKKPESGSKGFGQLYGSLQYSISGQDEQLDRSKEAAEASG